MCPMAPYWKVVVNSSLVHHMVVYACSEPPPTLGTTYSCHHAGGGECTTATLGEMQYADEGGGASHRMCGDYSA